MANNINLVVQEKIKPYGNKTTQTLEHIKGFKKANDVTTIQQIDDISDWNKCNYGFYKNDNGEFTNEDIGDSQTACIYKTFNDVINISFDYRVSSEEDFDFLNIYLDGARVVHISGLTEYENFSQSYETPTNVTIKFEYSKDESESEYDDAGYFKNLIITRKTISEMKLLNEIKPYKNIAKYCFEKISFDAKIPPKRIVFKNFDA